MSAKILKKWLKGGYEAVVAFFDPQKTIAPLDKSAPPPLA